jgi:hypothetical protein
MRDSALDATAYHEAGHIVMAWHVGATPMKATIGASRANVVATTDYREPMAIQGELDPGSDRSRLIAERAVLVSLAGPAAQRRFRPSSWRSGHGRSDLSRATALTSAVTDTPRQARALLKFLEIRAEDILEARWDKVSAIAVRLAKERELSHDEMISILTGR